MKVSECSEWPTESKLLDNGELELLLSENIELNCDEFGSNERIFSRIGADSGSGKLASLGISEL
jgi:hypothetical protein